MPTTVQNWWERSSRGNLLGWARQEHALEVVVEKLYLVFSTSNIYVLVGSNGCYLYY